MSDFLCIHFSVVGPENSATQFNVKVLFIYLYKEARAAMKSVKSEKIYVSQKMRFSIFFIKFRHKW